MILTLIVVISLGCIEPSPKPTASPPEDISNSQAKNTCTGSLCNGSCYDPSISTCCYGRICSIGQKCCNGKCYGAGTICCGEEACTAVQTCLDGKCYDSNTIKPRKPIVLVFDSKSVFRDYVFPNQDTKQIVYDNLAYHLNSAGFNVLPPQNNDWQYTVYINYKAIASDTQYERSDIIDSQLVHGTEIDCSLRFRDYKRNIHIYPPVGLKSIHNDIPSLTQDFYNAALDEFSAQCTSVISDLYK